MKLIDFIQSLSSNTNQSLIEHIMLGYNIIFESIEFIEKKSVEPLDVVGSNYNEIDPTQDYINPIKVDTYEQLIKRNNSIDPIDVTERPDGTKYITDGHHRFVASMKLGFIPPIKLDKVSQGLGTVFKWKDVKYRQYYDTDTST